MHAMHVLHLFSTTFLITDHQNILFSAIIFIGPRCPNYFLSTTCLSTSSGITILSPANSKPNRSVISLKTGENFFGAFSFSLFVTYVFCFSHFGSTEVLCIRVLESIIKLNSASFIFRLRRSSFSVFESHGRLEYSESSFQRYHNLLGQRWGNY